MIHCPYCKGNLEFLGHDPDAEYDEATGLIIDESQEIYDCLCCKRQLFYPHDWDRMADREPDEAPLDDDGFANIYGED